MCSRLSYREGCSAYIDGGLAAGAVYRGNREGKLSAAGSRSRARDGDERGAARDNVRAVGVSSGNGNEADATANSDRNRWSAYGEETGDHRHGTDTAGGIRFRKVTRK